MILQLYGKDSMLFSSAGFILLLLKSCFSATDLILGTEGFCCCYKGSRVYVTFK